MYWDFPAYRRILTLSERPVDLIHVSNSSLEKYGDHCSEEQMAGQGQEWRYTIHLPNL